MTMVDSGAAHNFSKDSVAKNLGLRLEEYLSTFKEVNSQMEKVIGRTKELSMKIGDWSGLVNFTVVPMDNFNVVLGMDFMRIMKATPVTYVDNMVIFSGDEPIFILMVWRHLGSVSLTTLSMLTAWKLSDEKIIVGQVQGCWEGEKTSDDNSLKKELEQKIAKLENIVSVETSSVEEKLTTIEVAMSMMVTSVSRTLENYSDWPRETREDMKTR